jgi:hypothetical protein
MLKIKNLSVLCSVALARRQQTQSLRYIVHFKRWIVENKKLEHFFPRSFAGYISNPDDNHLKCWNCNEDFSHCVHSMVILISKRCNVSPKTVFFSIKIHSGIIKIEKAPVYFCKISKLHKNCL